MGYLDALPYNPRVASSESVRANAEKESSNLAKASESPHVRAKQGNPALAPCGRAQKNQANANVHQWRRVVGRDLRPVTTFKSKFGFRLAPPKQNDLHPTSEPVNTTKPFEREVNKPIQPKPPTPRAQHSDRERPPFLNDARSLAAARWRRPNR